MRTYCEQSMKLLIPSIRALLAQILIDRYGFTQVHTAKLLGLTQPAISYYLGSKRGAKAIKAIKGYRELMAHIESLAGEIAEGKTDVGVAICEICRVIRGSKEVLKSIYS
ncbi:MAG: hypothetical protein QW398_03265 [Desulfurococcaceae archaeon]